MKCSSAIDESTETARNAISTIFSLARLSNSLVTTMPAETIKLIVLSIH